MIFNERIATKFAVFLAINGSLAGVHIEKNKGGLKLYISLVGLCKPGLSMIYYHNNMWYNPSSTGVWI